MNPEPFEETRRRFEAGTRTPRELLEGYLELIDRREKEIGAFVVLDLRSARAAADDATARYRNGRPLSLIDGLPIGLKDNFETRDMPTSYGSPIFKNWRGGRDSAAAYALRQAGAVLVGKLTTTEFAATVVTAETRNPLDPSRTPGGSSSGPAAAVAAGMLPVAIGTQVVGSVIRPASYCGVVGFKPSFGAVNRAGCGDVYSQNCLGTLSANLDDAYLVCHEIATRVGGDPGFVPFRGGPRPRQPRRPQCLAAVETAGWALADGESKAQLLSVLDRLAADGVAIKTRRDTALLEYLEQMIADARDVARKICAFEALWPYSELSDREPAKFSKPMHERIATGRRISADEYAVLLLLRDRARSAFLALEGDVDAFVTLAATGPAPTGLQSSGDPAFNVPFTNALLPAMSLPLLSVGGMPVGLQLVGFPNRESELSEIAQYLLQSIRPA